MNKIITGFPLYHTLPATFFTRYLAMNKPNVLGHITVNGVYLPISMAMIVEQALKHDYWDYLVIMESDTIPPDFAFDRVAEYDQDIVGSVYFKHSSPYDAIIYIQEEGNLNHNALTPQTIKQWTDDPALYECSAVGMGFTAIARRVLENWDKSIPMFEASREFLDVGSHDLWFCYQARQQGYKVYVDTGIVCDHLTEVPIGLQDNQAKTGMSQDRPIVNFGKDVKTVLSVGSGPYHTAPGFEGWQIQTLDLDPNVKPDIIADARELTKLDKQYDGVYCSHTIEHFVAKDVPKVLEGLHHVLKPDGKLIIYTPDMGEVNRRLKNGAKESDVAYVAEGVGITYYDIMNGLQTAVKAGNEFMRHHTMFTKATLKKALAEAGFKNVVVKSSKLELQATATK